MHGAWNGLQRRCIPLQCFLLLRAVQKTYLFCTPACLLLLSCSHFDERGVQKTNVFCTGSEPSKSVAGVCNSRLSIFSNKVVQIKLLTGYRRTLRLQKVSKGYAELAPPRGEQHTPRLGCSIQKIKTY